MQRIFQICSLVAAIAVAASPLHAQTTAVGPYYAVPSWDQTLPAGSRFIVLSNFNNDAVLDRDTGLVWVKSPGNTSGGNYVAASDRCRNLIVGNHMGWRLPTVTEMTSLIDPSQPISAPQLPPGHPFVNVPTGNYWTATESVYQKGFAYYVNINPPPELPGFPAIYVNDLGAPTTGLSILNGWCVRSGQGVSPQ